MLHNISWRWFVDVWDDVSFAVRTLRWHSGFALVAVISLAIGIGFNTAVFSIINTIFFQGVRGVPDASRVVFIGERESFATFRYLRDGSTALSGLAAWQPLPVDIRLRGLTVRDVAPAVSTNYFAVLAVPAFMGRYFEPSARPHPPADPEVVLDHEFWAKLLEGDPSVVGARIAINGIAATVVGIAPRSFHGIGPERPPLWMSMGIRPALESRPPRWDDPSENGWRLIGRLQSHATMAQVDAEMRTLAAQAPELFARGALRSTTGGEGMTVPSSPEKQIEFLLVVVLPLVVVGLILWIGCSNVANLLLARAVTRRKEIAIRVAAGATRLRLIRLLLTESLVLALLGGALGLLVAVWTLDLARATLPEFGALAVELDARVLGYTGAICVLATLLFGMVPALHATRMDVAPVLKGGGPGGGAKRSATRIFFLVTQFAASMALLLVAGTFVRAVVSTHVGPQSASMDHLTFGYLESKLESPSARAEYWREVRDRVLQVPGVASVTLLAGNDRKVALQIGSRGTAERRDEVALQEIDGRFFATTGATAIRGRLDLDEAHGRTAAVVINERAASHYWGSLDVVGQRLLLDTVGDVVVSGVVRDGATEARVFRRRSEETMTNTSVLVRTVEPSRRTVAALRELLAGLSEDRAFTRVMTLREASVGPLQRITRMAVIVGTVALTLAAVGLFGSISFLTSQRTREIAIRTALGAPPGTVLRLVGREGFRIVAAGAAIGLIASGIAFRFMSGMLFATWNLEVMTVAGVGLVLAASTLAACYVPARRALRISPMDLLKSE